MQPNDSNLQNGQQEPLPSRVPQTYGAGQVVQPSSQTETNVSGPVVQSQASVPAAGNLLQQPMIHQESQVPTQPQPLSQTQSQPATYEASQAAFPMQQDGMASGQMTANTTPQNPGITSPFRRRFTKVSPFMNGNVSTGQQSYTTTTISRRKIPIIASIAGIVVVLAGLGYFVYVAFFVANIGSLVEQDMQLSGNQISIQIPEKFEKSNESTESTAIYKYGEKETDGDKISQGIITVVSISDIYTPDNLEYIKTSINDINSEQAKLLLGSLKESFKFQLESTTCQDVELDEFSRYEVANAEFALKIDFKCTASDKSEVAGSVLDVGGKNDETLVTIAVSKPLWEANGGKFEKIFQTLQIEP